MILRTLITISGINALGLVNSILLSRWMGPAGRGDIAAAMLWPGLLVYLSSMGLIVATMYFSSLPDSKPGTVLSSAIVLGLVLSVIALPIGFAALPWLLKSQTSAVINASRMYLIVIPFGLIAQFGMGVLQGRLRISELNWLRTIIPIGYLVGTLSLMALGLLTLIHILVLHLFLSATVLVSTFVVLAKLGFRPGFQADAALSKRMLSYGAKVHVGTVSGFANASLDQILIAAWLPSTYLGIYVVAISAAGLSQVFSQAVQTVATPGIAQKGSEAERGALLQGVFRRYWLLSILIMLAIGAILPIAIPLIFGIGFKPSIWPAEILLLASFFMGAKAVLAGGADALGNPWLGSKANIFAMVVTFTLLYVLLPRLGIVGAAIASAAAYFAELSVVIYGLRRSHSISPAALFRFRLADVNSMLESTILRRAKT